MARHTDMQRYVGGNFLHSHPNGRKRKGTIAGIQFIEGQIILTLDDERCRDAEGEWRDACELSNTTQSFSLPALLQPVIGVATGAALIDSDGHIYSFSVLPFDKAA